MQINTGNFALVMLFNIFWGVIVMIYRHMLNKMDEEEKKES